MRKFLVLTIALLMMLALAACNEGTAPLIAPEPDEVINEVDDVYDYEALDLDETIEYDFELGDDDFEWEGPDWDDMPVFGSWSGRVVSVDIEESEGITTMFIQLEGEDGPANFVTDFNTFILGDTPEEGDFITGYYLMNMPMIMIFPPQYSVSVIVNGDFYNIAVDRFDENMVSYDGFLELNIGEDTEIILQNGEPMSAEDLAHRKLVVVYDVATRSIPAITTPQKIIVLFEQFAILPMAI